MSEPNIHQRKGHEVSWTEQEMMEAELIHGPSDRQSDTYRLWIHGTVENPGKYIDVPGWMVGDEEGAALRMKAAEIIRRRVIRRNQGDLF